MSLAKNFPPMPIPPFDDEGVLRITDHVDQGSGPSLVQCTLPEMYERFVMDFAPSFRRREIWAGWMRYRTEVETLGIPYATWIGGSFLTTEMHPRDLDLCIFIDSSAVESLGWAGTVKLNQLCDVGLAQTLFGCHPNAVTVFPVSHRRFVNVAKLFSYWTRVFGTDRTGKHRSILIVTERGTYE